MKYFRIPVALTWFMQKTFDGKKPYRCIKTMVLYALRPKVTDGRKSREPAQTLTGGIAYAEMKVLLNFDEQERYRLCMVCTSQHRSISKIIPLAYRRTVTVIHQ